MQGAWQRGHTRRFDTVPVVQGLRISASTLIVTLSGLAFWQQASTPGRDDRKAMDYTALAILACIFIPLERLLPLCPDQPMLRRDWANDLFYALCNGFVIRAIFTSVAAMAIRFGPERLAWTSSLPLWLQVIGTILVADTGYYIAHRTSHAVPLLWKFHAVHHSIEEMDWLATHRVHPLDQVFTNTLSALPIYFLGFSLEAIVIHGVLYQAQALLIHSNTRLRFGPLKWILASPEYHHWHHANEPDAYDRNFAAQLSVIDLIAGTLFMPKHRPRAYGINEPMPHIYPLQLLQPFRSLARGLQRQDRPRKERTDEQDA